MNLKDKQDSLARGNSRKGLDQWNRMNKGQNEKTQKFCGKLQGKNKNSLPENTDFVGEIMGNEGELH